MTGGGGGGKGEAGPVVVVENGGGGGEYLATGMGLAAVQVLFTEGRPFHGLFASIPYVLAVYLWVSKNEFYFLFYLIGFSGVNFVLIIISFQRQDVGVVLNRRTQLFNMVP